MNKNSNEIEESYNPSLDSSKSEESPKKPKNQWLMDLKNKYVATVYI